MFFDEAQTGAAIPEVLKYVLGAVGLLVSNGLTFYFSRGKTQSEVDKNLADAHKSEADTAKTRVETVAMLLNEVDEMIVTTKQLRTEIDRRGEERSGYISLLNKALIDTNELIDEVIASGGTNLVRIKAVTLSDKLHKLRDALKAPENTKALDPGVS